MPRAFTNRKSGFIQRGGAMRRETLWAGIAATRTTLAIGVPVLFTGFPADILALRPFTIVRTRGLIGIASDQEAADESYLAHMGISVVSDEALAVGVTAVPAPETRSDSDLFFVYESMSGRFHLGDATGFAESAEYTRQFDSKAMRKVEDGQDIALVLEAAGAPFGGCLFTKTGRMLIKLH